MNIGHILQQVSKDRAFTGSWLVFVVICLFATVFLAFHIHPSELNTQVRYSAFGVVHIYSNAWYYLLPIVLFGITILGVHTVIAVKLFLTKNQHIARLFIWLSTVVVLISIFIGLAILGLASF